MFHWWCESNLVKKSSFSTYRETTIRKLRIKQCEQFYKILTLSWKKSVDIKIFNICLLKKISRHLSLLLRNPEQQVRGNMNEKIENYRPFSCMIMLRVKKCGKIRLSKRIISWDNNIWLLERYFLSNPIYTLLKISLLCWF